jgi:hypothetical protein
LKSAAPVYATDVDDVVLVTVPVPEAVVDFVVFREVDVPIVVTPVEVTLDAVVERPVVVLEPLLVDVTLDAVVELPIVVLEPLVVDDTLDGVVEGPVVVLELLVVELEEVIASVQLPEAKAATPSANADSKGAANVAARD